MASPGNRHCAKCIGTLLFPLAIGWHGVRRQRPQGGEIILSYSSRPKAVFDLTESRFRFAMSPDLDSLANRMVWIRERCRV